MTMSGIILSRKRISGKFHITVTKKCDAVGLHGVQAEDKTHFHSQVNGLYL